jgi:type I restriction enzyme S subunit
VLFGRRRAYLKKAAQAKFSGICSGDITVMRVKKDLLPELLPFVINNEKFFDYAVKHSAGGLSPRVKFKDLANYEFLLPPKDQQVKLVELLWAMDEVVETELNLLTNSQKQLDVNETTYFSGNTSRKKLRQVVKNTLSGGTPDTKVLDFYENGTVPWITTKILESDVINSGEKYITEGAIQNSAAKIILAGNIVAGTRVGVGKFCINQIDLSFSQDITGLIVNQDEVDIKFLIYQLNSNIFQKKIKPFIRGTTIQGITKDDLLNLSILVPERAEQIKVRNILKNIKKVIKHTIFKIEHSKALQKSLINQIF